MKISVYKGHLVINIAIFCLSPLFFFFRPFVIGRKNWIFNVTHEGARASATFYSLIETAKANGLEPSKYLRYLFEKFPYAKTSEDVFNLLPMNVLETDLTK